MEFKPQERISVRQQQLHSNCSVLLDGNIVAVQGDFAKVQVAGEVIPRMVPLKSISKYDSLSGEYMTGRPNENPVINAIRR